MTEEQKTLYRKALEEHPWIGTLTVVGVSIHDIRGKRVLCLAALAHGSEGYMHYYPDKLTLDEMTEITLLHDCDAFAILKHEEMAP